MKTLAQRGIEPYRFPSKHNTLPLNQNPIPKDALLTNIFEEFSMTKIRSFSKKLLN